ncbi:hypothetical protein BGX28_008405 [Mortierella sp. GBA30]|nr:hypothetical protein BGX28_008405 [Mortierella sp. GBA30]
MSNASCFPTRSYRPLQCPTCKELLLRPLTLPCGFTVCQTCLPPKETIDFANMIRCPFKACSRSNVHSADELSIDVTLTNLTTAIRTAAQDSRSLANILSEDIEHLKPHKQPDMLYYGSAALDASWDATLEGLFDPYDAVAPTEKARTHVDPSLLAIYHNIPAIVDTIRPRIQQEIECQVCFLVFDQPLTTICGHTFCRSCLITSLDHKPNCPLCRRKLPLYIYYHNQRPNKSLVRFLQYLSSRPEPNNNKDSPAADEVLPEDRETEPTLAPRYRKLLRNVLKTESKIFGMVLPPRRRKDLYDVDRTPWEPSMEYGTLLKVLSCELLPDGRALVETVGLSRFQVLTYSMMDGYYTATAIELVHDIPEEQELGLEKAMLEAAALEDAQRAEEKAAETKVSESNLGDDNGLREQVGTIPEQSHKPRQGEETEQPEEYNRRSLPRAFSFTATSPSSSSSSSPSSELLTLSSSYQTREDGSGPYTHRSFGTPRRQDEDKAGLKDLHELNLDRLSRKQLMQILLAFVAHMQEQLGPLATQRLQREFGEMVEDEGQFFSFWVASILPVRSEQKYGLLQMTCVRQRLVTVVGWIRDLETRRSMSVCTIS